MTTPRIRTLLIDDSAFIRRVIADLICSDKELELIGTAVDGKTGTEMISELRPDVVVTDMVMPDYDGMYVVKSVMERHPVPIILLSSLGKTNHRIFDALQSGAFEFIDKPSEKDYGSLNTYPLLALIKEAFRSDITLLKDKSKTPAFDSNTLTHTFDSSLNYEIIVIGASTGGPGAVESIIMNLPRNLNIPVVIAQHMPARFLETYASRLNERSHLQVKLATKGETLRGGVIYIAPGESNLRIELNAITGKPMCSFTTRHYSEFNCPSVNCLFESVAEVYGSKSIGVILTGMGSDGTEGLFKIHQAGGYTIAQDAASCVVYGMPKSAVDRGAVSKTVKLKEIPGFLISCL